MKRKGFSFLMALMLLSIFAVPAFASSVQVVIDGQVIQFPDQQPYIDDNDRTLVPMRAPMEAIGCKVSWDQENSQATIEKDSITVVFTIGQKDYTVNGEVKQMDTRAVITGDRTCIPIRYAVEAFGASVGWDNASRTVKISTRDQGGNGSSGSAKLEVEPIITVTTGVEPFYMAMGLDNFDDILGDGYKFKIECTNRPELNVRKYRVPCYGPEKYDTVRTDAWQFTADWFLTRDDYAYTTSIKPDQVIEYRIYMKDANDQIIRTWEGKATLTSDPQKAPAPVLVKEE